MTHKTIQINDNNLHNVNFKMQSSLNFLFYMTRLLVHITQIYKKITS